jgi:hypothetical protein
MMNRTFWILLSYITQVVGDWKLWNARNSRQPNWIVRRICEINCQVCMWSLDITQDWFKPIPEASKLVRAVQCGRPNCSRTAPLNCGFEPIQNEVLRPLLLLKNTAEWHTNLQTGGYSLRYFRLTGLVLPPEIFPVCTQYYHNQCRSSALPAASM